MRFYRILLVVCLLGVTGCYLRDWYRPGMRPPMGAKPRVMTMETTGYCRCGQCCGWKRNWFGRPVVAAGPQKGIPKEVGVTASGSKALPGTIAADTSVLPFGTLVYVPGYGYGRVEDRGSDIKGRHIDLYFRSHGTAKKWGRQQTKVKVWPAE